MIRKKCAIFSVSGLCHKEWSTFHRFPNKIARVKFIEIRELCQNLFNSLVPFPSQKLTDFFATFLKLFSFPPLSMRVSGVGSTIVFWCVATAVSVLSVIAVAHRIFFSRLFDRKPLQVFSCTSV